MERMGLKSRLANDLCIMMVLTLLLALVVAVLPSNFIRILLGLPFLLFFPGYGLIAALFPRRSDLEGIERVALSFGLSIAVVPLIGVVLNYTPWGIRLYPILTTVALFIFVTFGVAWFRRRKYPLEERYGPVLRFHMPAWQQEGGLDRALSVLLVIAILGALGTLGYVIAKPKVGERFTEFYIVGLEGQADLYPSEFVLDGGAVVRVKYKGAEADQDIHEDYGRVTLGIVNREHQEATYAVALMVNGEPVEVWLDGESLDEIGPITLLHEEEWQQEIGFAPEETGEDQKVEFLLYMDGDLYFEEGESLHLWVDVTEAS